MKKIIKWIKSKINIRSVKRSYNYKNINSIQDLLFINIFLNKENYVVTSVTHCKESDQICIELDNYKKFVERNKV